jgi:hypothetical protein
MTRFLVVAILVLGFLSPAAYAATDEPSDPFVESYVWLFTRSCQKEIEAYKVAKKAWWNRQAREARAGQELTACVADFSRNMVVVEDFFWRMRESSDRLAALREFWESMERSRQTRALEGIAEALRGLGPRVYPWGEPIR